MGVMRPRLPLFLPPTLRSVCPPLTFVSMKYEFKYRFLIGLQAENNTLALPKTAAGDEKTQTLFHLQLEGTWKQTHTALWSLRRRHGDERTRADVRPVMRRCGSHLVCK